MTSERRLRLFITARVVVTILFLASTIVLKLQDPEALDNTHFRGIVQLMVLSCVFSAVSLALVGRLQWRRSLSRLQVVWDILFVTMLLILTDGIASPYSFLYLLAIMSAGMLISRRDALYTAALCVILYGAMVDMQYYGMLSGLGLTPDAAHERGEVVVFYTLFLHLVGFVLAALASGYLSERAQVSEDALRISEVNYEELRCLHSTIVEHLESGLLTVTTAGGIRVFNPYLQRLTGLSQEEAYNRSLASLFPDLALNGAALVRPRRGEFSYRSASGDSRTIGYTTTPYRDTQGETAGQIVTLKDLTELKQMEQALKRSDRLAALGELSARMAHEIRNPLAAISGSVQLLTAQGGLPDQESRLLAIVTRESERLNGLITDFLAYARPRPPRLENVDLRQMLLDLRELLAADQRFRTVQIELVGPPMFLIRADRGQLHQVLLNLLHNAAEAMPEGGTVTVEMAREGDDGGSSATARIMVADQGCGIDDETMRHLFEPFWTTKTTGSGLGLATVYRIIEGHGGTIRVSRPRTGGTLVVVRLPMTEAES
ncbi:two-component system sensor histidine kinase NtrB [Trichlorobacter ammonificans]|uniref:histidine kinase n=1 Tax=Trichlorobacter ammonificans TaxID=2916410 RepID=A0ABN8HF88_9BACT|nr:ATP-binding protein [Trichlorobacter ammonificans]CAH2031530.1 Two-component sensor PilS [Trichlorobacter ammonificans]